MSFLSFSFFLSFFLSCSILGMGMNEYIEVMSVAVVGNKLFYILIIIIINY